MKTVKKDSEYKRVEEDKVGGLLKEGWAFCKKEEWKNKVRDIGGKKVKVEVANPNKPSKVKKDKKENYNSVDDVMGNVGDTKAIMSEEVKMSKPDKTGKVNKGPKKK